MIFIICFARKFILHTVILDLYRFLLESSPKGL